MSSFYEKEEIRMKKYNSGIFELICRSIFVIIGWEIGKWLFF